LLINWSFQSIQLEVSMSLGDAVKKLKYDKRLTENLLKYNELTEKDLQKHLDSLEDVASNSETLNLFDLDEEKNAQAH
jgi:hypothetical protein